MRISDWSSDVCSSDLQETREDEGADDDGKDHRRGLHGLEQHLAHFHAEEPLLPDDRPEEGDDGADRHRLGGCEHAGIEAAYDGAAEQDKRAGEADSTETLPPGEGLLDDRGHAGIAKT